MCVLLFVCIRHDLDIFVIFSLEKLNKHFVVVHNDDLVFFFVYFDSFVECSSMRIFNINLNIKGRAIIKKSGQYYYI